MAPVGDDQALREAAIALTKLTDLLGQLVSELQRKLVSSAAPAPTPARVNTAADPATVTNAINAFLIAKARAGKSERYLRAVKNSLTKFSRDRSTRYLDDVTVEEVERWLSKSDWNSTASALSGVR